MRSTLLTLLNGRLLVISPLLVGAAGEVIIALLAQTIVRIRKTHESEMAACNKSFTSSCFVHFLNNNRTLPPSPALPLAPLCLGSIISQTPSSKPPSGLTHLEGGWPEMPKSQGAALCPTVTPCLLLLVPSHLGRNPRSLSAQLVTVHLPTPGWLCA